MQIRQLTVRFRYLSKSSSQSKVLKGFSTLWIIVAVAIVGTAAVLAFGVLDVAKIKKPDVGRLPETDQQLQQLSTFSTSDEVVDIEKDLNATDLDAIDNELSEVDRDLGDL